MIFHEAHNVAFWISKNGEMIEVENGNHIATVLKYPEKYGYTKQQLKDVYDRYHETVGTEGKAREEIILSLVRKGWIRIRRYENKFWSVTVNRMDRKVKDYLHSWASKILKGTLGYRENDPYMKVNIIDSIGNQWGETVKGITQDELFKNESGRQIIPLLSPLNLSEEIIHFIKES